MIDRVGHFRKHGGLNDKVPKGALSITNVDFKAILTVLISIQKQNNEKKKSILKTKNKEWDDSVRNAKLVVGLQQELFDNQAIKNVK